MLKYANRMKFCWTFVKRLLNVLLLGNKTDLTLDPYLLTIKMTLGHESKRACIGAMVPLDKKLENFVTNLLPLLPQSTANVIQRNRSAQTSHYWKSICITFLSPIFLKNVKKNHPKKQLINDPIIVQKLSGRASQNFFL